jgi:hypothetical protein
MNLRAAYNAGKLLSSYSTGGLSNTAHGTGSEMNCLKKFKVLNLLLISSGIYRMLISSCSSNIVELQKLK